MRIHYLVLAHRGPRQLAELLSALTPPDAPWTRTVVHVDADVDVAELLPAPPPERTRFLDDRRAVSWGGWSIVEATLDLLRAVADDLDDDDYVVLLSGDSYPLATQDVVRAALLAGGGAQHVDAGPFPDPAHQRPVERMSRLHLEADPREGGVPLAVRAVNRARLPRRWRRALQGRDPRVGSQWWAITGAAARWVLEEHDRSPRLARFSRHSLVPDEMYLQTLLAASPFAARLRATPLYADFSRPQGPYPAPLDAAHLDLMLASRDASVPHEDRPPVPFLFTRKTPDPPEEWTAALRERVWPHWAQLLAPDPGARPQW